MPFFSKHHHTAQPDPRTLQPFGELLAVRYEASGGSMAFRSEFEIELNAHEIVQCAYWPKDFGREMVRKAHVPVSDVQWADVAETIRTLWPLFHEAKQSPSLPADAQMRVLDGGDYARWFITRQTSGGPHTAQYDQPDDRRILTLITLLQEYAEPIGREIPRFDPPVLNGIYFRNEIKQYSYQCTPWGDGDDTYRFIANDEPNRTKRSIYKRVSSVVWDNVSALVKPFNPERFPKAGSHDKVSCTLYYSDGKQLRVIPQNKTADRLEAFLSDLTDRIQKEDYLREANKMRAVLSLVQAFLYLISSLSVVDSDFKERVDRAAIGVTSTTCFSFPTANADSFAVTESERAQCRAWYDRNIRCADGTHGVPAYDFSVEGQSLQKHPQEWSFDVGQESETGAVRRGGKTTYITLRHKESGLVATVEATIYEAYATCEWTVYLQNTADSASPVISSFYAADCILPTGKSELYVSKGSGPDANDFELHRSFVNAIPMRFNANGGRSESTLPYFNLHGKKCGVVMAVGWTGQWYASLSQRFGGVAVRTKQETFRASLNPQETVRSPLVSVTFYSGENALKGFNMFRDWESNCVYTESATQITTAGLANEFSTETADEMIRNIRSMPDEICEQTNFLWMDAGWYKRNGSWYDSVGNWSPDPDRFPNGLAPISEAAAEKGMGLLLWYEPERCCAGTEVYNEASKHTGWLLRKTEEVNMVNLANDEACTYLGDLIADSIRENKVGLYRQDFNFTPLLLWENADQDFCGGRKGITENHYVTNLYRYLDRLLEVNPGLIIDNCASGGKRLDLEMSRRSIPLWRTDYNCGSETGEVKPDVVEATQVNTYGISFWLPLHGSCAYVDGEYADRTNILPCAQRAGYRDVREYMTRNYYPLCYGGLRTDRFLAMQFGDANDGVALIYKREHIRSDVYTIQFQGLQPNAMYTVWDYDNEETKTLYSGAKLMAEGLNISLTGSPKCAIMCYKMK